MFAARLFLTVPFLFVSPAFAGTYYVDSAAGDDQNPGIAIQAPWRSLTKVNSTTFRPGDRILFKSGSVFQGQLWPKGSGSTTAPIVIDLYGGKTKPIINGAGAVEDAVKLHNQQGWHLLNLEITNHGAAPAVRRGVHISLENFGTAKNIRLAKLYVHDVNGDLLKKDNGGIVWRNNGPQTPSRFDGLIIEECLVERVDRSAIVAQSGHWNRQHWFPNLHVIIRGNTADDIGGDGITPWASDGALVERNTVSRCNARSPDYNAGIWPWSCDNTVIQNNEAFMVHGTRDGQGFDSDYNSRNTVIQYNYSHDNEGGFVLICDDGSMPKDQSIGNIGTVIRYNISQNDRVRTFHMPGPVKQTQIYNNTIYIGKDLDVNLIQMSDWNGWPSDTQFFNNIFYVEGTARYGHEVSRTEDGLFKIGPGFGPAQQTVLSHNAFFGNHVERPSDDAALLADPQLVAPGSGQKGLGSLDGYKLKSGSPAINAGKVSGALDLRDFWGNRLRDGKPDLGAHEFDTSHPGSAQKAGIDWREETERAERRHRALIAARFFSTFGVADSPRFWSTRLGGETPMEALQRAAAEDVAETQALVRHVQELQLPVRLSAGMTDAEFLRARNLMRRDVTNAQAATDE